LGKNVGVLFVCLHGSAKSVVAAAHLRRIAGSRGLEIECTSAGLEPDDAIPPHVVAGLAADGLDSVIQAPRLVNIEMIEAADYVVSFGCELPGPPPGDRLRVWEDVPAVSDGYGPARDAIIEHLTVLIEEIAPALPPSAVTVAPETRPQFADES
jgi:hypothetical protein